MPDAYRLVTTSLRLEDVLRLHSCKGGFWLTIASKVGSPESGPVRSLVVWLHQRVRGWGFAQLGALDACAGRCCHFGLPAGPEGAAQRPLGLVDPGKRTESGIAHASDG